MSKRSRGGERDAPGTSNPTGQQQKRSLYLIFDDWESGYSIRKLNLNLSNAGAEPEQRRLPLPPPFIRLEATRESPEFFAAVGTKILATHPRPELPVPGGILPMVDVRSRGLHFAPGELYPQRPIYIPVEVDDEELLFALDMGTFKMLSMESLCPQLPEHGYVHQINEWLWHDLPMPTTFNRMDVTSYAVDSDGRTILASTADATFAFDTQRRHEWEKRVDWSLPFSGRAYFVHGLDVFVGLPLPPKDGHLCFCRWLGDDEDSRVWLSKENLSSKDPAEDHVGTTLVYLGQSRFCTVECVSNGHAGSDRASEGLETLAPKGTLSFDDILSQL